MTGGLYYTDMLDVLRAAGCKVAENSITNGWQSRARSSGGFPAPPLGVWWHHTASNTSPANDLNYMINGSPDAPVGNLLLDRTGTFWPVAAGASNCAGKGGPWTFSRGTVPKDQGNVSGWQLEVANSGVGQSWPTVQVDAYFAGSNALNERVHNKPTDVITHHAWAPDRKIDPATATAVQGVWQAESCTSSGTWELDDIRAECQRRAADSGGQTPDDGEELGMTFSGMWKMPDTTVYAVWMSKDSPLGYKTWMHTTETREAFIALCKVNGWDTTVQVQTDPNMFRAFGPVIGPNAAGVDEWGVHL